MTSILHHPLINNPISILPSLVGLLLSPPTNDDDSIHQPTVPTNGVVKVFVVFWLCVEVVFYCYYRWYMIPRVNQRRTEPLPFLVSDYAPTSQRHIILIRILQRMYQQAQYQYSKSHHDQSESESESRTHAIRKIHRHIIQEYFYGWFYNVNEIPKTVPELRDYEKKLQHSQSQNIQLSSSTKRPLGSSSSSVSSSSSSSPSTPLFTAASASSKTSPPTTPLTTPPSMIPLTQESMSSAGSSTNSNTDEDDDEEEEEYDGRSDSDDSEFVVVTTTNNSKATNTTTTTTTINNRLSNKSNSRIDNNRIDNINQQTEPAVLAVATSNINNNNTSVDTWTIPDIRKEDMDEFISWGVFGKTVAELDTDEIYELQVTCYQVYNQYGSGLQFTPTSDTITTTTSSSTAGYRKPRRLNMECMNPLHRPLLFYIGIIALRVFGGIVFRTLGFQRIQSTNGATGWYRPIYHSFVRFRSPPTTTVVPNEQYYPIVYFHGIAPGGVMLYFPMVVGMILYDWMGRRPIFFFDNPNIASTLGSYSSLKEDQYCYGIHELIEQCLGGSHIMAKVQLTIMGHSFGSCHAAWLVHSSLFYNKLNTLVLLDPVCIMLSEPDVMVNFLYNAQQKAIIRAVASSELFTETFLRRHFAWYNSEIWFEQDLYYPHQISNTDRMVPNIIVALSEHDTVVNSPKVKDHIDYLQMKYATVTTKPNIQIVYWKNCKHADCVARRNMWNDIRYHLLAIYRPIHEQKMKTASSTTTNNNKLKHQ